jgi:hypothetical protein
MSEKSEVIENFSTNPEVIELVDKLWNLSGRDNSTVEAMLASASGKEEDAVILELENMIDRLEQQKSGKMGGSKKRRNSNKNKKSRRNKKSNKRRRRRQ